MRRRSARCCSPESQPRYRHCTRETLADMRYRLRQSRQGKKKQEARSKKSNEHSHTLFLGQMFGCFFCDREWPSCCRMDSKGVFLFILFARACFSGRRFVAHVCHNESEASRSAQTQSYEERRRREKREERRRRGTSATLANACSSSFLCFLTSQAIVELLRRFSIEFSRTIWPA